MGCWFFIKLRDAVAGYFGANYKQPTLRQLSNDKVYAAFRARARRETDRLLDKISKYGEKSLTGKEKKFLANIQQDLNKQHTC